MRDDDYLKVCETNLTLSDMNVDRIIAESEAQGIKVKKRDYEFFGFREVELGDYRITKRDLNSGVYTAFDIKHAEHEWHSEPEINITDPVVQIIAKYAREGDFITFEYEGSYSRWVFRHGKVKEIYPKITFDWSEENTTEKCHEKAD